MGCKDNLRSMFCISCKQVHCRCLCVAMLLCLLSLDDSTLWQRCYCCSDRYTICGSPVYNVRRVGPGCRQACDGCNVCIVSVLAPF